MNPTFKIADVVAVIDDTIRGVVKAVDGNTITIETSDGFDLDFEGSELVVIQENQRDFSKFIDIKHDALLEKEHVGNTRKQSKKSVKARDIPPMEVDLHIQHLTKSTKGMSNYEMLNVQLDTAKRQLEFAIAKKIPRVVFIHGVGEGVLKKELENLLKRYNVALSDASFQKYGFGATEVYIYQN